MFLGLLYCDIKTKLKERSLQCIVMHEAELLALILYTNYIYCTGMETSI